MTPAPPKPRKGESLLNRRTTRAERVKAEQAAMRAALVRDQMSCRVPRCEYRTRRIPVDPCHQVHRSMGGNPTGDRTTRDSVIALCRIHHGQFDRSDLDINPVTEANFDGPCRFTFATTGEVRDE